MSEPAGTEQAAVGGHELSGGRFQQAQRPAAQTRRIAEGLAERERVRGSKPYWGMGHCGSLDRRL